MRLQRVYVVLKRILLLLLRPFPLPSPLLSLFLPVPSPPIAQTRPPFRLGVLPGDLDAAGGEVGEVPEDDGGDVDAVAGAAGALVGDDRRRRLAVVVDPDGPVAVGAVVRVRAGAVPGRRQRHHPVPLAVLLPARPEPGRVVCQLLTETGGGQRCTIAGDSRGVG